MNWWTRLVERDATRLLVEADLVPVQGSRFQPTGFPDLGAAEYLDGRGRRMLLVESAQSMANRLEAVCWDEAAPYTWSDGTRGQGDLVDELHGLPYVRVRIEDGVETSSILEAHRLNSPFISHSDCFPAIREAVGCDPNGPFDRRRLAAALLRFDPNSLVHGIFLTSIAGVVRLPRLLSAFIEAHDVAVAASGGAKIDRVQPATGERTRYGTAQKGYGNVVYSRDEYTAARIVAYFNLDVALLRGLGLSPEAQELVAALALYKVLAFLAGRGDALRLRTACDLDVDGGPRVTRPEALALPTLEALREELPGLIAAVYGDDGTGGIPSRVLEGRYRASRTRKTG